MALFSILIGMFFIDSGREILLSGVTKYFQLQNTVFTIKGLDRKITKIDEIFIRSPDGIELIFSNVSFKRQSLLSRSSIYVDKFVLNGANQEIDLDEKLKDLVPLMRTLRIFIADLSLGNGVLNILGKTWTLDGLRYKSLTNKDYLYSKIDNYYVLDVFYRWKGLRCIESNIKFEKFMDIDGELYIKRPEKGISEYKFNVASKNVKIKSAGTYKDFMLDILIQNAFVEYQDKTYNLEGNLYIKDKKTHLTTKLDLADFTGNLPIEIKQNFENVVSIFDINYSFAESEKSTVDIKFKRLKENIGNIKCSLQNNSLDASGDIDWINIYGFQAQKISCKSNKLEDFNIKIDGDGFDAASDIKIGKKVSVEKFNFGSESCGFLRLSKPCILDRESEYHFDFKFNRADFWNKIVPIISGDISGTISYKKGNVMSRFNSKNLCFENSDFHDLSFYINGKNVDISTRKAYIFNSKCQDLNLKIDNEKIKITGKINDHLLLDAAGNIKLKSENGVITGGGNLSIRGLVSRANTIDTSFKLTNTGTHLDVILKNRKDLFKGNLFVPIYITNDGTVVKNLHAPTLNCHIQGSAHVENLIELSDRADARGLLNCDVKILGSFANPIISGNADLKKAYFIINDILLKNGTISLSCKENKISVLHAEFVDTQKKKLNISGNGTFYFNHIIPNIKTNLHLNFDNFRLFDSDKMKILILGNGNITGDINDLLISGDVDITKCKIQKFDSDGIEKNDDIIIENERNVKKQPLKESKKADFCKYNVNMRCPKINIIGSVFEMELLGNLKLLSYENQATLSGSLKLREGRLDLFGKRLRFTKGEIEFIEKYPFDPIADFLCERNFGEMIVYLEVTNRPEEGSSFVLYSVPNHTQDVILAYILFGKELKYLSISEAAQLANAIASFRRKGYIFSILNTFQTIGLIDTLSFASNDRRSTLLYSDETSSGQNNLNVSAGKYIHDNIYISVNRKSDNVTTFDVDLSLTPKMSIKANSIGEVGVSWKYRY